MNPRNNIRTTYAYDSAGRLEYETVTREAGGTTNLSRTQYAYAYIAAGSGGGRSLTRTESSWDALGSAWVNDNKVAYTWNALEWMRYEQRHDWVSSAWSAVYDVSQEYDKNGNRTRYHKNVQGLTADYGSACDLTYGYDGRNFLNTITDADTAGYSCAVTCDLNNNITEVIERRSGQGGTPENNFLYTYFEYDDLNRLTEHKTKQYSGLLWFWTKREHGYDALGRAAASAYTQWPDGSPEPGGTFLEHVYDQSGRHLQNYDGTSAYGAVWHWAGTEPMPNTAGPLRSPNADTVSQVAYNDANNVTPQRRTYLNPTTEGDKRNEWGQGRPQAKDASGTGSNWATGTLSQPQNGNMNVVESRLMFEGTVTTDLSRATDAREKSRIGIFGTGLSYAGSYGRVTSETIGRDLNPLGRGDGMAYVAGWMNLGILDFLRPESDAIFGIGLGNSVNNGCCGESGGAGHSSMGLGNTVGSSAFFECYSAAYARWLKGAITRDQLKSLLEGCYEMYAQRPGRGGGGSGSPGSGGGSSPPYAKGSGCSNRGPCSKKCGSDATRKNEPRYDLCVGATPGWVCEKPRWRFNNCKYCMPSVDELCAGCFIWDGYNPCACAWSDCVRECALEGAIGKDCAELLKQAGDSCIWELGYEVTASTDFGTGLQDPRVEGRIRSPILKCLEELEDAIEKIKKDPLPALGSRFIGILECLYCCWEHAGFCAATAIRGDCELFGGAGDENYPIWGFPPSDYSIGRQGNGCIL